MTDDQCQMSEGGLHELAAWAKSVTIDDVPEDVRQRAALVIADDLACAVGSRDEPELVALKSRIRPGTCESTVLLGDLTKFDRADAAMLNSVASNWCQLDEGHREVMCHAGLYVVPAAAAEAEATGQRVEDVLRATIIGYEVVCRFAQAYRFARPTAHPHAMWSALGAAATVAALRKFDEVHFVRAVTSAVTMAAAGPFAHAVSGALIANAWAGLGVATGFACAQFAECGIGGLPSSPFEVLQSVLGATVRPEALHSKLGSIWMLRGGYHKVHSCAQQSHAAVEATLALTARLRGDISTQSIRRVVVECHRLALSMENREPLTTLAARFSIPHIVAATCVFGHANASAFAFNTLHLREIQRLRSLVELKQLELELPAPHDRAARVTFILDNGTEMFEECLSAEGGPDRPLGVKRVIEKCEQMTNGAYPFFGRVASELCHLEENVTSRSWPDLIRELTRQTAPAG